MYSEEDEITQLHLSLSPEEFLAQQKESIRRKSWWGIGIGATIVLLHIVGFIYLFSIADAVEEELGEPLRWRLLFRSVFFILGLMTLAGGLWGLYYARKLTLADLIPSEEAQRFLSAGERTRPLYSTFIIACLIVVTIAQLATENVESIYLLGQRSGEIAGLVKPLVWEGEWWRILTASTLHGFFPLHLYFNSQALYGFGSLVEQLSNRAHLPIVFVFAVIGGGIFSLFFMPNIMSIGASGGIMGLIGYMAVFGYKRRQQLPSDFLRTMLLNIGAIAAFGLIGYQFLDNFAHLGGLVTGALYGLIQVPSDPRRDPRQTNWTIGSVAVLFLVLYAVVCLFTILKLTGSTTPF